MVPRERASVALAAVDPDAAEKLVQGPISEKKCENKVPKKIHKSEREKHKRDQLNDLFTELGKMLEADRQNNGKACILTDATRVLRDLLSQVDSLRKENSTLQNESHYVTVERNELQDENSVLRNEISELQNELSMRQAGNPIWAHGTTGSSVAVPQPTSTVFALQQPLQPPAITTTVFPVQQPTGIEQPYPARPQELQLFPEAVPVGDRTPSQEQEAPSYVMRPQARYPTPVASWPV